jgi:hypothetical protein
MSYEYRRILELGLSFSVECITCSESVRRSLGPNEERKERPSARSSCPTRVRRHGSGIGRYRRWYGGIRGPESNSGLLRIASQHYTYSLPAWHNGGRTLSNCSHRKFARALDAAGRVILDQTVQHDTIHSVINRERENGGRGKYRNVAVVSARSHTGKDMVGNRKSGKLS